MAKFKIFSDLLRSNVLIKSLLGPLSHQSTDGSVVPTKQSHECVTGLNPAVGRGNLPTQCSILLTCGTEAAAVGNGEGLTLISNKTSQTHDALV